MDEGVIWVSNSMWGSNYVTESMKKTVPLEQKRISKLVWEKT